MFDELKKSVYNANIRLKKSGLIVLNWGNVSQIDRENGLIAIKPSGVDYDIMTKEDIVVVDMNGKTVEGRLKPSSDLATHIEIYKAFPETGGVAHTHSKYATVFSQAGMPVKPLGTTHADAFYGSIPVTRKMTPEEINGEYEKQTGIVIAETFKNTDPAAMPAVLVHSHGPFTWGRSAEDAVNYAIILEEVCFMAWHTLQLNPDALIQNELLDKHYLRKHGANAYYGQGGEKV